MANAKIVVEVPPPAPPPKKTVVLELTPDEARWLLALTGGCFSYDTPPCDGNFRADLHAVGLPSQCPPHLTAAPVYNALLEALGFHAEKLK